MYRLLYNVVQNDTVPKQFTHLFKTTSMDKRNGGKLSF